MLWILCGLASALFSTAGAILSERTKVPGTILAPWFRIVSVIACLPFVAHLSLPTAWQYWALVLASAVLGGLNDVVIFNSIQTIGAGATSRFRRTSILLTFIIWLIISPALLLHYLDNPAVGIAVLATHVLAVVFALRLKKDDTSWTALKMLWFPIMAAAMLPILSKLSFEYVPNATQGVFSYLFIQSSAVMLGFGLAGLVRNGWRHAVPGLKSLGANGAWKTGATISLIFVLGLMCKHYGYSLVENPAYISVLLLTDTIWVLLYHKLSGIKDKTDVVSGMGIVACAAALILIQIFFE